MKRGLWGFIGLLVVALLIYGGVKLMGRSEWVETEVRQPATGAAAKDDLHALKRLARGLGVEVEDPSDLSRLPPPVATLLLTSSDWALFPERGEQLKTWVAQGGRLVLFAYSLREPTLSEWLPVAIGRADDSDDEDKDKDKTPKPSAQRRPAGEPQGKDDDDGDRDSDDPEVAPSGDEKKASKPAAPLFGQRSSQAPCRVLHEATVGAALADESDLEAGAVAEAGSHAAADMPSEAAGMAGQPVPEPVTAEAALTSEEPAPAYKVCGFSGRTPLMTQGDPVWSLDDEDGPELLRVPHGRGSVTVLSDSSMLDNNQLLQPGDNARVAVLALQLRRGATAWFVVEEAREPFLRWLWHRGGIALLLCVLALLAAWWRAARRFGPLMPPLTLGRRSMAEQVTGTAQFLQRTAANALYAAQLRALDERARTHIPRYETLKRHEKAAAIARHTGLEAQALDAALDRQAALRHTTGLPAVLQLLETARRRLLQRPARPAREPRT